MSFYNGYNNSSRSSSFRPPAQRQSRGYSSQYEGSTYSASATSYGDQRQLQTDKQMFRNAQASKQMVIKVYENVIGALEELEERQLKRTKAKAGSLKSPAVHYADQSSHTDSDVERQLEAQLLLFETQIKSCSSEIRQEVKELLKKHTLRWNSVRSDMKIPHGPIDEYLAKLFQILAEGSTSHPSDFYRQPNIDERHLKGNYEKIMHGQHQADLLDREFRDNPDKKARDPQLRGGSVSVGAERLATNNPSMDRHLRPYRDSRTDLR